MNLKQKLWEIICLENTEHPSIARDSGSINGKTMRLHPPAIKTPTNSSIALRAPQSKCVNEFTEWGFLT
jgi:hypothetical protein